MKKLLYGIVFLLVVVLLVACGGQQTSEAEQPSGDTGEPSAPQEGEKITLRLWSHQNAAFQAGNQAIIDKFMEQNPNIEVKYETFEYDLFIQTLQTSMPAGTEADVIEMFGTWVCSYADGGRLLQMPDNLMTYSQAQDVFFQAPLDGYNCGNKLYGLPQEFNLENGGALVNPALFEAHDVTYPPQWSDFDALRADAAKMSEFDGDVMTRAGFHYVTGDGIPFAFFAAILQQGGNYFAEDGRHFNFDTPEARNAIQLLVDMAQEDKVVDPVLFNDESNWVGDSFFAGNVAVGFVGSWAAGEGMLNYPDMEFDYVEIPPYFGSENKFAADSGWGKVVSVNTEHPEEAWKLAMFMAAEQDNALIWNSNTATIPAMKALVENPEALLAEAPFLEATFNLLPHGQFIGDLTDRDQIFYEIVYPHILDALQGVVSVEDAALSIHTEANAVVDSQ
jgi:multiple sugar transport system substrate-binding protein